LQRPLAIYAILKNAKYEIAYRWINSAFHPPRQALPMTLTESSSAVEYCGLPSIPWIYRALFLLVNPTKLCEEWHLFSRAEAMLGLGA
jgi:hypothetical protein